MTRLLVILAAVGLTVGAILGLRAVTMTVHTRMPQNSELVVEATARWKGGARAASNRSRALAYACVAESSSPAVVEGFRWEPSGAFEVRVVPALDEPDRRQLEGCLTDLRVPRLLVSVDRMWSTRSGGAQR